MGILEEVNASPIRSLMKCGFGMFKLFGKILEE
jgi:hypothetical protein